jgi:hypothetical protein
MIGANKITLPSVNSMLLSIISEEIPELKLNLKDYSED